MLRKHVNNTDVAIEILKRFYVGQKNIWKLKVKWYNIGTKHAPIDMKIEQRLELTPEALREWRPYEYQASSSNSYSSTCRLWTTADGSLY